MSKTVAEEDHRSRLETAPPRDEEGSDTGSTDTAAPGGSRSKVRRSVPRRIVLPILLVVLAIGAYVGYQYWTEQQMYVSTDNAQVTGSMVQVAALNAGRIESVMVNVGDRVRRDQPIASILLPSTLGLSQSGTPLLGFVGSENQRTTIKAPMDGIVVARSANPGATITAGQTVVTLIDPTQFWVNANIDETHNSRIQVGQRVDVHLDALGQTVAGRVEAITPATASAFSLLPQSNTSGSFTKVTQVVPVRISMELGDRVVPLDSSVSVRIRVNN